MSGILLSNYSQTSVQGVAKSPSDFVFFNYDSSINSSNYKVLLEDLAGKWVNLGRLSKKVAIPATHFGADAKIVVLALSGKARYVGEFHRGQLYILGKEVSGDQYMRRVIPQYH